MAAAIRNIKAESYIQGGSTITQQLVKNFFLTPERTFRRKVQEALLAFVLERRAQKKDILELYLNEVYLGQIGSFSIHGLGQAARMYFHKDVANLTVSESALLAGMIQSPNPYNPYRHPQRATERRNLVLNAMGEAGFLDEAEVKAAKTQPLGVERPAVDTAEAPYFVDFVGQTLAAEFPAVTQTTDAVDVYTTLDLHLQRIAQDAVTAGIARVDQLLSRRRRGRVPQAALIAVDLSNETLERTTLGSWKAGRRINLERPLRLGDELGGHIVSGHVDGRARIIAREQDADSIRFVLEAPMELARFIAAKGSVALDGVSLTVNSVDGARFSVNIIPYTLAHTTWQDRRPADQVNLEVDILARYVRAGENRKA